MKTLVVVPATARHSPGADDYASAPSEPFGGTWVGFLLNDAADAGYRETILGGVALDQLQIGDIIFTGSSNRDAASRVIDRAIADNDSHRTL